MKALRIVLTQTTANYAKEEAVDIKMTYPLPPFSTIIGAIHEACGFKEYVPMDISVQGKYDTMSKKLYTSNIYLNASQRDRNTLVYSCDESILSGFSSIKVCTGKAKQGNDFLKEVYTDVHHRELLEQYKQIQILKNKKTPEQADKYQKYKTLCKGPRFYEVLYGVELVIHVAAEEKVLNTILEHVYDIRSIGRSEDFIDVKEAVLTELTPPKKTIMSPYSAYLKYEDVINGNITIRTSISGEDNNMIGTKYHINKCYSYEETKNSRRRIFEKKKVIFCSSYMVHKGLSKVLVDEKKYIVSLL